MSKRSRILAARRRRAAILKRRRILAARKRAAARRRRPVESKNLSPLQFFKNRAGELPSAVRVALARRQLRMADHEYYSMVKASGQGEISMFSKVLNEGLATNMHEGVVPNDDHFMITSIVLTTAVGGAASDISNAVTLDFTSELDNIIQNAKFSFKCGQNTYFSKCSAGLFQGGSQELEVGEYKLANPVFIKSKQALEFNIEELGAALPAETWVKIRLKGVKTIKK